MIIPATSNAQYQIFYQIFYQMSNIFFKSKGFSGLRYLEEIIFNSKIRFQPKELKIFYNMDKLLTKLVMLPVFLAYFQYGMDGSTVPCV